MATEAQVMKDDTFAGLAADYMRAHLEEARAEEELDRAKQRVLSTTERAQQAERFLKQEKHLLGKMIRTAVIDGHVVTLMKSAGDDSLKIIVTDADVPLGSRRR